MNDDDTPIDAALRNVRARSEQYVTLARVASKVGIRRELPSRPQRLFLAKIGAVAVVVVGVTGTAFDGTLWDGGPLNPLFTVVFLTLSGVVAILAGALFAHLVSVPMLWRGRLGNLPGMLAQIHQALPNASEDDLVDLVVTLVLSRQPWSTVTPPFETMCRLLGRDPRSVRLATTLARRLGSPTFTDGLQVVVRELERAHSAKVSATELVHTAVARNLQQFELRSLTTELLTRAR